MTNLDDVGARILTKLISSTRHHIKYNSLPKILRKPDVILRMLADGYIDVGVVDHVDSEGAEEYANIPDERRLFAAIRAGQDAAWAFKKNPRPLAIKITKRGLAARQLQSRMCGQKC